MSSNYTTYTYQLIAISGTSFVIGAPIVKPVAKRKLDVTSKPRLTRADEIRQWQATAIDDTANYGRNPFRVSDEVEVIKNGVWIRARVIIVRGRYEHYRVCAEHPKNEHSKVKLRCWVKAFSGIRLYEPRIVRTLKID